MMDEKPKRDELYPIRIRLKGGDGTYHFHPGEALSGSIEIHPVTKIACRSIDIRVGWYSEGKGSCNDGTIMNRHYPVSEITPDTPFYEQFDVELPRNPWSHVGHYINIVW